MNSCLCKLIIFLYLIVISWQQDTPVTSPVAAPVTAPVIAPVAAPVTASLSPREAPVPAIQGSPPPSGSESWNKIRVPVKHTILNVDQVLKSNYRRDFNRSYVGEKEKERGIPKKKDTYSGPPINAHNRHRKNYILPGRRLRTERQCRPYEVFSKAGKCVRKKGKKGVYKHKNHVYGHQRRHRHRSAEQKVKENDSKNKPELN